jgi:ribonuclease E
MPAERKSRSRRGRGRRGGRREGTEAPEIAAEGAVTEEADTAAEVEAAVASSGSLAAPMVLPAIAAAVEAPPPAVTAVAPQPVAEPPVEEAAQPAAEAIAIESPAEPGTALPVEAEITPPTAAVASYDLPVEALSATASAAGLQWVQSDPEAVRRVQEALAAMPAPIRVPRERKPAAKLDEGPLVLVETVRPLPTLQLPENAGH